jgi:hypothetical protein
MSDKTYVNRKWLNGDKSASTGSIVAFYGETSYGETIEDAVFLEISDCHCKVHLHKLKIDTISDFINKLKIVAKVINDFILFLEKIGDE